ncbi:MAG: D-alanyl-D-alanine carboxypeptidase family protein [Acidobacteriota bacterium]
MKNRSTIVSIALALCLSTAVLAQSNTAAGDEPYTAAIVIEPTTNTVIYEKNPDQPYPTASMIKMLTLLVVMDHIKDGSLTLDTPVTTSAHASKMGGSQVYLKQGEVFPVRDLIAATMVHSANDAAEALAEQVGGTDEAFVELMRQKAKDLGLKNYDINSPHGLPAAGEDKPDIMSPRDLAIVGIEIMKYPMLRELAQQKTMPFRDGKFTMYNPNHLLSIYPYATGIKTGYHAKAGFCVTASARKGDMDLVGVIMGCQRKEDSFRSAAKLFSVAFAEWQMRPLIKAGTVMATSVKIRHGAQPDVQVVAGGGTNVLTQRGHEGKIQMFLGSNGATAPIKRGQRVGTILVKRDGKVVATIPALARADVAQEAWYKKFLP